MATALSTDNTLSGSPDHSSRVGSINASSNTSGTQKKDFGDLTSQTSMPPNLRKLCLSPVIKRNSLELEAFKKPAPLFSPSRFSRSKLLKSVMTVMEDEECSPPALNNSSGYGELAEDGMSSRPRISLNFKDELLMDSLSSLEDSLQKLRFDPSNDLDDETDDEESVESDEGLGKAFGFDLSS